MNLIKVIQISLPILCCSPSLFGQKELNGTYSALAPLQEHYRHYSFNKKGSFEYHSGAGLGDDYYGFGHYSISNDLLILNFDSIPEIESSGYYQFKHWTNNQDNISLKFKVYDLNKNKLSGTAILVPSDKLGSLIQDGKGELELPTKSTKQVEKLRISLLGYETQELVFNRGFNYEFEIYLKESSSGTAIINQIDTLKITQWGDDFFEVKGKGNKSVLWKKREVN
jgi:hypothetical protein